uniref:SDS3 homolog, SIN3A corepressor complex component n=1 Tax=Macaca nemestrina TaxID=9545 RepID=A0A2K6AUE7_MACNE
MSVAGLLAPASAQAEAPPAPKYYPEEDEELESAEDELSCPGRESDEDTEDSETDLAKHDEEDYVEMKEQMYQDKLASLKRQLQQPQEGTLQEYQKRMKKLDQRYKERIRNAELFLQLETEQKAAVKEFKDKKVELKENLIAELEEKKKMIENEKGEQMIPSPSQTRGGNLLHLSHPRDQHLHPLLSTSQRFEAPIEDGKLCYDKRWYHKSQAIHLESKDNQKLSCMISSVGASEIWVRKTSDSIKMRIYLGQLQPGLFVICQCSAA